MNILKIIVFTKVLLNVRTCNLNIKMINEILKLKSYKQIERNMKIHQKYI